MELVGEILKKRRKDKNLTLFTISQELKISQEILNNIENNFLQHHIDSVFIIGHLRSYCSFLELNHNEIIELFKKQNFPENKKKY